MNHEGKEHAGLSQTFLAEEEVCAVLVLVLRVNTPDSSSLFQMTRVVWMFAEPHHWSVCRVQGAVGDTGECSVVPRQPVLGKPGASAGDSSGAKLVSPSCVKLSRWLFPVPAYPACSGVEVLCHAGVFFQNSGWFL